MKKTLLLIFALAFSAFAADAPADSSDLLKHAFVSLEGGALYPLDDEQDVVTSRNYYSLLEFRYAYFEDISGVVQFGYAYYHTKGDSIAFPGVHQFNGRVGLDFPLSRVKPISVGTGFSCDWMRADGTSEETKNSTLGDNETEFGWYVRLDLPVILTANYRAGVHTYFEQIWTEPDLSNIIWVGIYVERKLW